MSFWIALSKELKEQWRSYRFLAAAVLLIAFGMLSPVLARYMRELFALIPNAAAIATVIPEQTIADAIGQYIKNLSQFGVLLALLLPMGSVVQEKERGTAAMLLSKPLSRGAFLLAKFAAHTLVFLVSLLIAGLAGYFYTLILFGSLPFGGWMAMNGLLLLYLLVYVALVLLFSTLARSQLLAVGMGFGVLILLGGVGAIPGVGSNLPGELLNWGAELALGQGQPAWVALGVSLGLVTGALLAAWLIFRRQEL
jgi:ABC-2 type transport system permease protein